MIEPQVFPDYEAMSCRAAERLVQTLRERPSALLCLAAGATPLRTYARLVEHHEREPRLFRRMSAIKLDEWGGLAMDDPASCERSLRQAIVDPLDLRERYIGFESRSVDPEAECQRIAGWIDEHGPIDTCVLGLGLNGHVGFNEPADYLTARAHVAQLARSSLQHAMLLETNHVPTYGLTLGMADLLAAREILLLVSGSAKAQALHNLLSGRIRTQFPASLLWLHANVRVLCDAAAYAGGFHPETSSDG
jgi:galactosamine-6-phosphate isomerase